MEAPGMAAAFQALPLRLRYGVALALSARAHALSRILRFE